MKLINSCPKLAVQMEFPFLSHENRGVSSDKLRWEVLTDKTWPHLSRNERPFLLLSHPEVQPELQTATRDALSLTHRWLQGSRCRRCRGCRGGFVPCWWAPSCHPKRGNTLLSFRHSSLLCRLHLDLLGLGVHRRVIGGLE